MTRFLTLAAQSLLLALLFTACQKEVDIDLKSAQSNIVIAGEITDQPGPYTVKITRSVNFNEPNNFPAVTGATVVINDSEGNSETLVETEPGIYTGTTLQGVPGRSYTLTVNAGETYSAVSAMPVAVEIDTITFEKGFFADEDDEKLTEVEFTDPGGAENFYRFIMVHNNKRMRDIYIGEDRLRDGQVLSATLFRDDDEEGNQNENFKPGDLVTIYLQSIDKSTYNYFRTFGTPGGGDGSASPANPLTNLTNGALGYFSATAVRSKTAVYP